uniref:Ribosomal protein S36 n=1 Tax=Rhizosolenia fallax TaxID=265545 RepID=A0A2U9NRG1_9STRA|nr:ribosomal protein S36 [Rhizosolenia fallax]AWT39678.1 ribosomal protein S36 [Rhizosolenia fallax]
MFMFNIFKNYYNFSMIFITYGFYRKTNSCYLSINIF